jgi:hypothetical protein
VNVNKLQRLHVIQAQPSKLGLHAIGNATVLVNPAKDLPVPDERILRLQHPLVDNVSMLVLHSPKVGEGLHGSRLGTRQACCLRHGLGGH